MGKGHRSIQKRQKRRQHTNKIRHTRQKIKEASLEEEIEKLITELTNTEDKYKKIANVSHCIHLNNTRIEKEERVALLEILKCQLEQVEAERMIDAENEADQELTEELQELNNLEDSQADSELGSELDELEYSLVDPLCLIGKNLEEAEKYAQENDLDLRVMSEKNHEESCDMDKTLTVLVNDRKVTEYQLYDARNDKLCC